MSESMRMTKQLIEKYESKCPQDAMFALQSAQEVLKKRYVDLQKKYEELQLKYDDSQATVVSSCLSLMYL